MKTLKTALSLIMVLCMFLSLGTAAFAEDNEHYLSGNGDTIENNIGHIEVNYGTVEVNCPVAPGAVEYSDFNGDHVFVDGGVIEANSSEGEVGINNGRIVYNNGTVGDNNDGGTVDNNNAGGTVGTNSGTVGTNSGTVGTNSGTVRNNNGGTIGTNNETVWDNNDGGTVMVNNAGGTVWGNNDGGTVGTNNGTVTLNDNHGTVGTNNGEVTLNYGTVGDNYGTVTNNYGTVTNNYGGNVPDGTNVTNDYYGVRVETDAADYDFDGSIGGVEKGNGYYLEKTAENNTKGEGTISVRITPTADVETPVVDAADNTDEFTMSSDETGWTFSFKNLIGNILLKITRKSEPEPQPEPDPQPSPEPKPDPKPVAAATNDWSDGYYLFNKAVVKQIKNAEDGSTVTVDATGWASFMRMVFEALAEHPTVTLVVKYGNNKELTIPAGADILSAIGDAQDVLFTKLAKLV